MVLRIAFFLILLFTPFITSCSQAVKIEQAAPISNMQKKEVGALIILDPGHGGFDVGAIANHLEEKVLALQTAILVKRHLSRMGYRRVILTRSRDVFLPLKKRTAIANETKSRLLISLHYNSFKNSDPKGIEVYYYDKGSKWRSSHSKKLAQQVLSHMLIQTGAASRGVKHGNFHMIRETQMPAILVEGGFITHPDEHSQLKDQKYLSRLAQGIAEGIDQYFHPK